MAGNSGYAWVVVVATGASAKRALLSGKMLRRTETSGSIIALVSASVPKEVLSDLYGTFDMVAFADCSEKRRERLGVPTGIQEEDLLLLLSLNLTAFSKLIVLVPGVFPLSQADHLFDDDSQSATFENAVLMMDECEENWKVAIVEPELGFISDDKTNRDKVENKLLQFVLNGIRSKTFAVEHCKQICNAENIDDDCQIGDVMVYVNGEEIAQQILVRMSIERDIQCGKRVEAEDSRNWVAIVGMACRFPQADSLEEYWDILANGRNTTSAPPPNRKSLVDIDPEVTANFLKCPTDQFDAGFFDMSPGEASLTDPQARLLMEVSWEAFEHAGINPEKLRGTKTGVFYGSWLQDYQEAVLDHAQKNDLFRTYFGNGFGCSAAKLSFFYGFTGPNVSTESGCSSSMVAIDMGVKSLQRRECPVALACGTNVILRFGKQLKVWTMDGKCKAFDEAADGYVRAEGISVLVMKRYSDAIRDRDSIHGIIRGSATSQEGLSTRFGRPTIDSESYAMSRALKAAKVHPCQVDYVEAHASGTAVGDPIEAAAIVSAYSSGQRAKPLWIGSVKTNIGHAESCSGMAGVIKVLLAMNNETIPQHINLCKLNPKVDFSRIPGNIPLSPIPWPRRIHGPPRLAGVSGFGITGTDVHMIFQEPPLRKATINAGESIALEEGDNMCLLALSAKSESALKQLISRLRLYLETTKESLGDIAFTANACRPHHKFRYTILGNSKLEIASRIERHDISLFQSHSQNCHKICFVFPKQSGEFNLTTFQNLYKSHFHFRSTFDHCSSIFESLNAKSTPSLVSMLKSCGDFIDDERWSSCVLTCQYSLALLWIHWGVHPTAVAGHAIIGELTAALVCGAINIKDAYQLIHYLTEQPTGENCLQVLNQFIFQPISIPYVSGSTGDRFEDRLNSEHFGRIILQCRHTDSADVIESFGKQHLGSISLEMGFETVIKQSVHTLVNTFQHFGSLTFKSGFGIWKPIADLYLLGVNLDWEKIYQSKHGSLSFSRVQLPHYPFQRKSFWFKNKSAIRLTAQRTGASQKKTIRESHIDSFSWEPARFFQGVKSRKVTIANLEMKTQEPTNNSSSFQNAELELDQLVNRLCYLYVVKAFFEIGCWYGEDGLLKSMLSPHKCDKISETLGIVSGLSRAFLYFATYLNENNISENLNMNCIKNEIDRILEEKVVKEYNAIKTIIICGSNLAGILRGHVSAHRILFDERKLADEYYQTSRFAKCLDSLDEQFQHLIRNITASTEGKASIIRILEIGSGTGAFPKRVIGFLKKDEVQFEYHFTDISPTLVAKGTQLFTDKEKRSFIFKTLDIEHDPLSQGFPPNYFDLVVAYDVLHATRDLAKTLKNVGMVTRLGGSILIGETEVPIRELDICFGILEGYWLFEDTQIRKGHCTVGSDTWLQLLRTNGFAGEQCKFISCGGQKSTISARKTGFESKLTRDENGRMEWVIFQLSNGRGVEKLKKCVQANTGRCVKCVDIPDSTLPLDEHLEKIVRSSFQCLHGTTEGILFWLNESNVNELSFLLHALLVHIAKCLSEKNSKGSQRLHFITHHQQQESPISGQVHFVEMMKSIQAAMPGVLTKSIIVQHGTFSDDWANQLMTEIWLDDKESWVVYKDGIRYLMRVHDPDTALSSSVQAPVGRKKQVEHDRLKFRDQYRNLPDDYAKSKVLRGLMMKRLCEILGTTEVDIRDDVQFTAMGMDSLMSVDFENFINSEILDSALKDNNARMVQVDSTETLANIVTLLLSILK